MDGYTFMIERNRRLIQHEADQRAAATATGSKKDSEALNAALDTDLQQLYLELEGCGRAKIRARSDQDQ